MQSTQFDPADAGAQPIEAVAEAAGSGEHPVILLVATAGARRSGWGAASAVALADRVADFTDRVFLADLDFESPSLHTRLGTPNEEGLADVFFYGASLKHVTHRPAGHRFELISAGAFVPEPAEVLRHDRWLSIANDLGPGAVLLAYVPAEEEGALDLAARAFDAVVLGVDDEIDDLRRRWPDQAQVLAAFSPPTTPARRTEPAAPEPAAPEPVPAAPKPEELEEPDVRDEVEREKRFEAVRIPREAEREALIADLRQRRREAMMSPESMPAVREPRRPAVADAAGEGATARSHADGMGLGLPVRPGIRPGGPLPETPLTEPILIRGSGGRSGKGRKVFFWLLSFVVLAALAAGAWVAVRYWLERQALAPDSGSPGATQPVDAPPSSPEGPLPFSVAVEMHSALPLADERARSLAEEEPGIGFFVSPVLVDSALYYAVLAGPASDSAQAQAIVVRLLAAGLKTVSTPGDVRHTPLAFLLGEFATRREAEDRRAAAFRLGIPGYIIEARTEQGSVYRLYAGAYAGRGESQVMRELLRNAGLPDTLVNRQGISPS